MIDPEIFVCDSRLYSLENDSTAELQVDKSNTRLITNILDFVIHYVQRYKHTLSVHHNNNNRKATTTSTTRLADALLVAICLEVIANCGLLLKQDFRIKLQHVLYIMIEMSADEDHVVKRAAITSLNRISLYCGYNNVTDMYR